jgi:hypothetical protein
MPRKKKAETPLYPSTSRKSRLSVDQAEQGFAYRFVTHSGREPLWKIYVQSFPDDPDVQPTLDEEGVEHYPAAMKMRATRRANVLVERPDIRRLIDQTRSDLQISEDLTPEAHMRELAEIRDMAKSTGKLSEAIRAEELRGKAAGLYIERHLVQHQDETSEPILSRLSQLMEAYPELASYIRRSLPGEATKLLENNSEIIAETVDME